MRTPSILTHTVEALEPRIAPATLVNAYTAHYSDVDGDDVTVHFSKPLLTPANFTKVLSFGDGPARADGSVPQSLLSIDLTKATNAEGVDLSVLAKHSAVHGGDGHADVLNITAHDDQTDLGIDLGNVRVQGDLSFLNAGNLNTQTLAVKTLVLDSFGANVPGLQSKLNGPVGRIVVLGDMDACLTQIGTTGPGIGSIYIGGSLGRSDGGNFAGDIESSANIGSLLVAHDIVGSGKTSGHVHAGGDIHTLVVGGSIYGGSDTGSGFLEGVTGLDLVVVRGDLHGGSGTQAGFVQSINGTARIVIGGSILGGAGNSSGEVLVGDLPLMSVGGSVVGGSGISSGLIGGLHLGHVVVNHDVIGSGASNSGFIVASGSIDSVLIKGSLRASPDITSLNHGPNGTVFSVGSIGSVTVLGDLDGGCIVAGVSPGSDSAFGTGTGSAADFAYSASTVAKIANITVRGRVTTESGGHAAIESNHLGAIRIGSVTYSHADQTLDYHTGFSLTTNNSFIVREI